MDAGRAAQPWEGTGVHMLHETHKKKDPSQCLAEQLLACAGVGVGAAKGYFGQGHAKKKGQYIC